MGSFSAVCGIKNSGKTTLTEKIVKALTGRGMRVAVIKHDGHAFECDLSGKDSFRYVRSSCGSLGNFLIWRRGRKRLLFSRKPAGPFLRLM